MDAPLSSRPEVRVGLPSGVSCDSSAQCLSGACTAGACSDWAYAMRIGIDTSASGVDLGQAVSDFPLLVRLRSTNFAFAEARADGADLRFVDEAGRSLGHEIELWSQREARGDVWVSVPRIEPGRRDNVVVMYWGNSTAAPVSSGPAVFGHLALALHMGDATDGIVSHLLDSSGQGNTATVEKQATIGMRPEGIAGVGMLLDGKGGYLSTANQLTSPPTFAVSLWLKTPRTSRAGIAGFLGRQSASDVRFDRALWMDESGRLSFGVQRASNLVTVASLTGYSDDAWHHVVARSSGSGQYLFVDGESIADDPTRSGANSFSGSWCFGEDPTDAPDGHFAGTVDEIQVFGSEPSDAWIKLAYATQRPDGSVLTYQRLP